MTPYESLAINLFNNPYGVTRVVFDYPFDDLDDFDIGDIFELRVKEIHRETVER